MTRDNDLLVALRQVVAELEKVTIGTDAVAAALGIAYAAIAKAEDAHD